MLKTSRITRILVIFLLPLLFACNPMAMISIEVMKPAEVTIAPHIEKLAFLNRSYTPGSYSPDTIHWTSQELFIFDTIITNHIFKGLISALNESPLFDIPKADVLQLRRTDTTNYMAPLSESDVRKYTEEYGADALVSLEYYQVDDTFDYYRDFETSSYVVTIEHHTKTHWRIYDPRSDSLSDEQVVENTVHFTSWGWSLPYAVKTLQTMSNMIRKAGFESGRKYGRLISPFWSSAERYYYTSGSREMKKAGKFAFSDNWAEASNGWEEISAGENKKLSAKAYYNLAVAAEIEDSLPTALKLAEKSQAERQKKLTMEYIRILKKRMQERKILIEQVPVEQDRSMLNY